MYMCEFNDIIVNYSELIVSNICLVVKLLKLYETLQDKNSMLQEHIEIIEEENEELAKKSTIDALTSLYNRSGFIQETRKLIANKHNHKSEFALIFLDLNHLKLINDNYGHSEGDLAIKAIAKSLKEFSSESIASRIGGDEFLYIIKNKHNETADEIKERLYKKISEDEKLMGKEYPISASAGVTLFSPCKEINISA